jgi:hypothetical protein
MFSTIARFLKEFSPLLFWGVFIFCPLFMLWAAPAIILYKVIEYELLGLLLANAYLFGSVIFIVTGLRKK